MKCKNCHTELHDGAEFCHHCGARVIRDRISLKFLFQEFLDKVLSVDNKLLKTFIHLLTKPEEVIDGYISGTRKRYLNPISYLLISITLTGAYYFFFKDFAVESFSSIGEADPSNPFFESGYGENIFNLMFDFPAITTAINIPIYAFVSWLVFLNRKKYNFYEHVIIYLYSISQVTILSSAIVLPIYFINESIASDIYFYGSFSIFIYAAYLLIRLFKLNFSQFLLKTLLFLAILLLIVILFTIIVSVIMFFTITPEELENFKKAQDSLINSKSIDTINIVKDSLKVKNISGDLTR